MAAIAELRSIDKLAAIEMSPAARRQMSEW